MAERDSEERPDAGGSEGATLAVLVGLTVIALSAPEDVALAAPVDTTVVATPTEVLDPSPLPVPKCDEVEATAALVVVDAVSGAGVVSGVGAIEDDELDVGLKLNVG